jgi:hypothetical protein
MFRGCNSLVYLDLSNYISGSNSIFKNNNFYLKLKYLNLNSSNILDLFSDIKNIYDIITKNAILCINKNDEYLLSNFSDDYCITFDCSKIWFNTKSKLLLNDICVEDCKDLNNQSVYEYNWECYDTSPNGKKKIKS